MESERDYKDMLKEEEPEIKEGCDEEGPCCDEEACDEEPQKECCDEEEKQYSKQYWRKMNAKRDLERGNTAQLHVFKGQTKEQAEATLKQAIEERKIHPKGCTCGNCNFRAKCFASKSGKPEIYASKDQTIEQVKELLKKSSKSQRVFNNIDNPPGVEIKDFLAEDSDFTKSIRESYEQCDKAAYGHREHKDVRSCDYVMANWRKLAGVKRNEVIAKEEHKDLADELMNCILNKIQRKFPELKIAWSDDWERYLNVNGGKTNIKLSNVAVLYENLLHFTSKDEAKDIIGDIMLKKLSSLFI